MRILSVAVATFAFAITSPLHAQTDEGKAVLAVVDKLFDGMRRGDTAAMRATFAPQARMLGVGRQGEARADGIDGWLASIGRQPAGTVLNERTWAPEVKVDDNVAQAWMQYDFHIGDRFSHCGIDAFDLLKIGGQWKIVSVLDTRRTTGCTGPANK
ncbi:MAG TPA: nuclear transport factor 2 family protein [Gemmatimonadaceae bacterium]|nr:nuclear transport factor 2 family protein [Gemmatimonadaceae bacterium]